MSTQKIKQGTALSWKASGGDAVLTLTSLTNAAGRAGGVIDLGALFARRYSVRHKTKCGTSPAAGKLLRIAFAFSPDNANWPAGVSGSDSAFSDLDLFSQAIEVRPMSLDNSTNSQQSVGSMSPLARYVVPIIWNESGVALSATAGDHELVIVPLEGDST